MNSDTTYITRDTSLAAFLYLREIKLLDVLWEDSRGVFVFEDSPQVQELVDMFRTGRGEVSPLLYYRSYKSMIQKLKDAKRGYGQ